MITIQTQNFGVEIELTGITRQAAAQVIADYYGTIGTRFMGTVYKTYEAVDSKGRRWKCMRDASITPQRRVNGHVVDANDEYKCEFASKADRERFILSITPPRPGQEFETLDAIY